MIPERYIHNLPVYSEEEFPVIRKSRITVIGAGGLGGYIIEQLARLGIGHLKIIDDDIFETGNLNRQIYSGTETIGLSKAETAAERVRIINPDVDTEAVRERLVPSNSRRLLSGSDLVFDAADNPETKLLIQDRCRETGTAFIHGAVGGLRAQISLVLPGQNTLDDIYSRIRTDSDFPVSVPPFTPAIAASIQVAEGMKYLLGRYNPEKRSLLYFDLESYRMTVVDMGKTDI